MEVLEAFDLTGSFRGAAALAGCSHHTVARYVAAREVGGRLDRAAERLQLIDEFLPKVWGRSSTASSARPVTAGAIRSRSARSSPAPPCSRPLCLPSSAPRSPSRPCGCWPTEVERPPMSRGLLFAGMFGMFYFLTQFLQDVLGYSSLKTGFAFLPLPVTVFIVPQLTSRVLINNIHGKVLMLGGIGLAACGFVLASQLTPTSSYGSVISSVLLFAVGNGLSFVPLTSAALAGVPPQDAGAASGLVNVTQQLGGTLGVAVLVTIFGSASKAASQLHGASAQDQAHHAFTVGASHAFLGAALFLVAAFTLVATAVKAPSMDT